MIWGITGLDRSLSEEERGRVDSITAGSLRLNDRLMHCPSHVTTVDSKGVAIVVTMIIVGLGMAAENYCVC